ncbi:MAG: hydroxyacid dehydrogenase [Phycisphaerae bacterium]|nr:hydroxyacid dehydrogenase [Phycisphaerae bacterium]
MKVLIADKFEAAGIDQLKEMGCEILLEPDLKEAALVEALREFKPAVLIVRSTRVEPEHLGATDTLKVVLRAGSGYNTIDIDHARQRGIKVCNCPGLNSTAVAELTMGLIMALDRHIVDNVNDLRRGAWDKKLYGKARGLKGRTLGIVGMGQIGQLVARRALAFEMRILYHDVIPAPEFDKMDNVERVELDDLLGRADIVTLHVPELPETKGLIDERCLGLMQPHAFLVNTCRGSVVDEPALIKALKEKKIAAAACDVYASEPSSTKGEFTGEIKDLPNFYGTHHIGASTDQAQEAVAEEAVHIVREFKTSAKVLHCVNES